jgi:hypothetical protein
MGSGQKAFENACVKAFLRYISSKDRVIEYFKEHGLFLDDFHYEVHGRAKILKGDLDKIKIYKG